MKFYKSIAISCAVLFAVSSCLTGCTFSGQDKAASGEKKQSEESVKKEEVQDINEVHCGIRTVFMQMMTRQAL